MKKQLSKERLLRHGMIIKLACAVMLLSLNGCRKVNRKLSQLKEDIKTEINSTFDDDFYNDYGGRDYVRIPLIAPYELLSLEKDSVGQKWNLVKRNDINTFGGSVLSPDDYRVRGIGTCDSILYLSCKSNQSNEYKFMIVDAINDKIIGMNSIQELSEELYNSDIKSFDFAGVDNIYSHINSRQYDNEKILETHRKSTPNILLIIDKIISNEKTNQILEIDSVRFNRSHIKPLKEEQFGGFDSVAYLKYKYPNGNIWCEGWTAFSEDPEDDFSQEFGEWKYFDSDGNCYRKFWNYTKKAD